MPLADGRSFVLIGFADVCHRSDPNLQSLAIIGGELTEEIHGGICKRASCDQLKSSVPHLEKI
jgi:hypothetical protein